jgi:4-carboxymuconolactone decarboxylase
MPEPPTSPRIDPVEEVPEGFLPLNIFRTMIKNEPVAKRFNRLGGYLLVKGLIPAREREIVILRVGWRCQSVYEFGQHTIFGREAGLSDDQIAGLAVEASDGWADPDRHLIALADELCATDTVSDATWAALAGRWSEPELIELLILAGFYRLVSGFLNATGVQLEPGTPGWPGP